MMIKMTSMKRLLAVSLSTLSVVHAASDVTFKEHDKVLAPRWHRHPYYEQWSCRGKIIKIEKNNIKGLEDRGDSLYSVRFPLYISERLGYKMKTETFFADDMKKQDNDSGDGFDFNDPKYRLPIAENHEEKEQHARTKHIISSIDDQGKFKKGDEVIVTYDKEDGGKSLEAKIGDVIRIYPRAEGVAPRYFYRTDQTGQDRFAEDMIKYVIEPASPVEMPPMDDDENNDQDQGMVIKEQNEELAKYGIEKGTQFEIVKDLKQGFIGPATFQGVRWTQIGPKTRRNIDLRYFFQMHDGMTYASSKLPCLKCRGTGKLVELPKKKWYESVKGIFSKKSKSCLIADTSCQKCAPSKNGSKDK